MDSKRIGENVWYWPPDAVFGAEATAAIITGTHEDNIVDLITFPAGNMPLPRTRVRPGKGTEAPARDTWQPRLHRGERV